MGCSGSWGAAFYPSRHDRSLDAMLGRHGSQSGVKGLDWPAVPVAISANPGSCHWSGLYYKMLDKRSVMETPLTILKRERQGLRSTAPLFIYSSKARLS